MSFTFFLKVTTGKYMQTTQLGQYEIKLHTTSNDFSFPHSSWRIEDKRTKRYVMFEFFSPTVGWRYSKTVDWSGVFVVLWFITVFIKKPEEPTTIKIFNLSGTANMGRLMTPEEKEKTKQTYLILVVLSVIVSVIGVCTLYPIAGTINLIIKVVVTTATVLGLWFLVGLLLLIWLYYIIGNSNKY